MVVPAMNNHQNVIIIDKYTLQTYKLIFYYIQNISSGKNPRINIYIYIYIYR